MVTVWRRDLGDMTSKCSVGLQIEQGSSCGSPAVSEEVRRT